MNQYKNYFIYSPTVARHLIDNGFPCIKTIPHKLRPWDNVFLFSNTPELAAELQHYFKEQDKNGHRLQKDSTTIRVQLRQD